MVHSKEILKLVLPNLLVLLVAVVNLQHLATQKALNAIHASENDHHHKPDQHGLDTVLVDQIQDFGNAQWYHSFSVLFSPPLCPRRAGWFTWW